ncbi:MAG TPA: MmcQ/YjbR family DNA-binding protein [Thermomicrobiales bacterium]|jgi:hypothetical protein|nr:hypothetical protein [Chloroflexota bacterium]HQX62787.1 MmcQ/YjbR family DNA-binding protein [Thermomicrobiales bacterium]
MGTEAAAALRERLSGDLRGWPFARRRNVFGNPALTVPGTLFAFFRADHLVVKASPAVRATLLTSPDVYEWVPEGSGMRSFGDWVAVPVAGRSDADLHAILDDAYQRATGFAPSSMDPPIDL